MDEDKYEKMQRVLLTSFKNPVVKHCPYSICKDPLTCEYWDKEQKTCYLKTLGKSIEKVLEKSADIKKQI